MEENKEIVLKVKVDSYKDLQNYLHNELKITKKDIEELLEKLITNVINKKLKEHDFLYHYVEKVVEKKISELTNIKTWNVKRDVDNAIEKCIGEVVMKMVREQLDNSVIQKYIR